MEWIPDIERALIEPTARVMCIDASGGKTLPLPADLSVWADQTLELDGPLDLFAPESRASIVKAFGVAKSRGHSVVDAVTRSGDRHTFSFYDLVDVFSCFVVTMTPFVGSTELGGRPTNELRVRSCRYSLDITGNIIDVDAAFEKMLGWDRSDIIGRSSLEVLHPDDHETGIVGWIDLLEAGLGGQSRMRERFLTADGHYLWVEDTTTNHLDNPDVCAVTSELIDITDEMAALEEAERRDALLTRLTQALPSGVLHVNAEQTPTFWNERWVHLLGNDSPTINGLLRQISEASLVKAAIDAALVDGADHDLDVTFLDSSVAEFGRLHVRPIGHGDVITDLLITLEDTTDERAHQKRLHDLAHRDALTGLLSRNGPPPPSSKSSSPHNDPAVSTLCCSWTSTSSRPSTTPTATPLATQC